MLLNAPRSTERDNQNALRKYPLSDGASGTNGACVLVPGSLVDAQLYVHGREPGRVWLSSVGTDGRLRFSDADGIFAETALPATAHAAVPVTFTGTGGPLPGGVIVFGKTADVAALRALGGQSFSVEQTELASAAVTFTGLPGVTGFLLDDGNVVSGNVKFRGENGCDVSTYVKDGTSYLRISAIGATAASTSVTGFITEVRAESDNTSVAVSLSALSDQVVNLTATGVATMTDGWASADQEDLCAKVRTTIGSVPSPRATAVGTCDPCETDTSVHKLILMNGNTRVTWTTDAAESYIPVVRGVPVGQLLSTQIPAAPTGFRFAGYFDGTTDKKMYFRHDGAGVRTFDASADVTLYAKFVSDASSATVTFEDYGTLHLAAPSDATYANPLVISGNPSPVPSVREVPDDTLENGGTEALAEIVLHPTVPDGEVIIGLRGLSKASSL